VDLTASVDGETVTGTQRRIVAPAPALQARQRQALERRLADAVIIIIISTLTLQVHRCSF